LILLVERGAVYAGAELAEQRASRVNDPAIVRREYATEEHFLARRLATAAQVRGPLVEDAIVDAVREGTPDRVVDVGCGTGDFTERLANEIGADVVALDSSPRMAELSRARGLDAVTGDIEALPFDDGAFGCVLANRVLYHLAHLDAGLAEIARVLQSGGVLIAVTYSDDHLQELWDVIGRAPHPPSQFLAENGARPLREQFDPVERRDLSGGARFPSRRSILEFLAAYGDFSDVDLGAQLGDVRGPFDASYRHSVFVASKPR